MLGKGARQWIHRHAPAITAANWIPTVLRLHIPPVVVFWSRAGEEYKIESGTPRVTTLKIQKRDGNYFNMGWGAHEDGVIRTSTNGPGHGKCTGHGKKVE